MSDLIRREDVIEEYIVSFGLTIEDIERIPAVEAEPVVHSKWINVQDTSGHYYKKCRECRTYIEAVFFANDYDVNYCPCCGAKMDGGENE